MASYHLQIISPEGVLFDDQADYLMVRTVNGDMGILNGHVSTITSLGLGICQVKVGEETRKATCFGGLLYVSKEIVRVMPQIFEWASDIDVARAQRALEEATAAYKVFEDAGEGASPKASIVKNRITREEVRIKVASGN